MTKHDKTKETERETEQEENASETHSHDISGPDTEPKLLFRFEDFSITVLNDTYTISKEYGGISDSCYARVAVGREKNWTLLNEKGQIIDMETIHGNRPFFWQGRLSPGTYTLKTGRGSDTSIHRIPGRHFNIVFSV
ncbi:MAG: hypothetical protein WC929_00465 [Bacilli bacterium]|jgi:hypothetical protein